MADVVPGEGSPRRGAGIRKTLAGVAWLVIAAGVASILSAFGFLPAEISHGIPFVGFLAPIAICLAVCLNPTGLRPHLLGLACVEVACLALLWPDIRGRMSVHPAAGNPARSFLLVELNVWDKNPDPARTLAWLRSSNADVIVLEEAREPFIAMLANAFSDYPTFVTCANRAYCGVVILSRFKGRLVEGGWWVVDGLNHASRSPQNMALAAVELDFPASDGKVAPLPVVAVHLDRRALSEVTDRQSAALLGAVEKATGRNRAGMILAGDFNTSAWSPQMRRLSHAIDVSHAGAFAPTWPSGWRIAPGVEAPAFIAIDHVYAGCRWKALAIEVGPNVGSDHRPLVARLTSQPGLPGCDGEERPVAR